MERFKINNLKEWRTFCKSGKKPDNIPSNMYRTYRNHGWISIGDFLGTGSFSGKNALPFKEARNFARSLMLKNREEWERYCKSGKKPNNIPNRPDIYAEWAGWGDWLGKREGNGFLPFKKAREITRKLGLKSCKEWETYCKSGKKPDNIPRTAYRVYKDTGWIGMGDWLGTDSVANQNRKYRPFKEARKFARKLKLKNVNEWYKFCKSRKKPNDIPSNPSKGYKDNGWAGMGDWLGTGNIKPGDRDFLAFEEAREFVRELGLKSYKEWSIYRKSGKRPTHIPSSPNTTYRDSGWKGYGDWLGTGNIAPKDFQFLPFEEAKKFVIKLQLKNQNEWKEYCKSGKKPKNIPSNPEKQYKYSGWKSIGDWIGTGSVHKKDFLPFVEARKIARSLKLTSKTRWIEWTKSKKRPGNIPAIPSSTYKNKGWISWPDWLGTK